MKGSNRLPPMHALVAFESAARLGGFAQAAAELCITPSAVSHRIRLLEDMWSEQLFERLPTGVRLSDAGQRYLNDVCEAFDKLSQLTRSDAHGTARVSVGAPPTFARNLLIPRLPDFYRQFPGIDIDVAIVAPMHHKPDRHDVDVRFGKAPFDERPCSKLFDDELVVLAAPAYLAQRKLTSPADLRDGESLRTPLVSWREWFAGVGLTRREPTRGAMFTDFGLLLEAAASGMGVALCLRRVAGQWIDAGTLTQVFSIEAPSPATYHILVGHEQARRAEVVAFGDWLRATFT